MDGISSLLFFKANFSGSLLICPPAGKPYDSRFARPCPVVQGVGFRLVGEQIAPGEGFHLQAVAVWGEPVDNPYPAAALPIGGGVQYAVGLQVLCFCFRTEHRPREIAQYAALFGKQGELAVIQSGQHVSAQFHQRCFAVGRGVQPQPSDGAQYLRPVPMLMGKQGGADDVDSFELHSG